MTVLIGSGAWASVAAGVLRGPSRAAAEVEHGQGFAGVVDGYRSWYGSYRLGDLGEVWCVDHGIAAPDAEFGYEPTELADHAPETQRAVAWAVGRWGVGADRVTAAALMLVLHDLMGAVYPSGPLSVDGLTEGELVGFEGRAGDVLARAREIKADAVGRAGLVGPLSMSVTAEGEGVSTAGRRGTLRAAVVDAGGSPIGGVVVHPAVTGAALLGDVDATTGADDGTASWSFESGPGENRFTLAATVPGVDLMALRPTLGSAQRVARPSSVVVEGSTGFSAAVPRTFTIVKRGDAEPALGVTGARFTVSGIDGELVVGPDGRTPPLTLLPGTYTVAETAAPRGYDLAGPWTVVVADADVVLDVADVARRGGLDVYKVDAVTGEAVAGATFAVRGDVDGDPSTFEFAVTDLTAPLLVGRYEVREVKAPAHYRAATVPIVAEVRAGERTPVVVSDTPLSTMAFQKHPPLSGATFVVREEGGAAEVGRCTTAVEGRCALADDALEGGRSYCWSEVEAPPGWGRAEGTCVRTGAAGSITTVEVDEPPLPPAPAPAPAPPPPAVAVPDRPVAAALPAVAPPTTSPPEAPPEDRPTSVLSTPTFEGVAELPRTGAALGRLVPPSLGLVGFGLLLLAVGWRPRGRDQSEAGSQLVG